MKTVSNSWVGDVEPPLPRFENLIVKLMKETISSSWYNLPRRRRYLMKSVFEWHALQDGFVRLLEQTNPSVWLVSLHLTRVFTIDFTSVQKAHGFSDCCPIYP